MRTPHPAMRRGMRRALLTALGSAALVGGQLLVPVATGLARQVSPAQRPEPERAHEHDQARRGVGADGASRVRRRRRGVDQGDAVTAFKWMINLDNTGTTTQRNANPGERLLDIGCRTIPTPASGRRSPACKSSAPVVAQGDETTLPGRWRCTSTRAATWSRSSPTATSSTARRFTIPWSRPRRRRRPAPAAPAAERDDQGAGLRRRHRGERPVRPRRGRHLRIRRQDHRLPRPGEHRRVRQPAVHDVRLHRRQRQRHPGSGRDRPQRPDYEPTLVHLGGKCLSGDINMDGVVNGDGHQPVRQPRPGSSARPRRAHDPEPRPEPLRAVDGPADRLELGPDDDPRRQPRLGRLGHGGRDRPRHRVRRRRRAVPGHDLRLRARSDDRVLERRRPQRSRPVAPARSRASSTRWTSTSRRRAASTCPTAAASRAPRSTTRSTSRGSPCRTSTAATPRCTSAGATPTARSQINNVPDGTYTLTYWDEPQNYILDLLSVTVVGGETVDMGILPLAGWFTKFDGYVFNDTNRNGKRDAGEPGVPNFGLTLRKRENSLMDRGSTAVGTDQSGHYVMESAYPLTEWLVLEAYDDRYYTTGVTYQADNQRPADDGPRPGRRRQRPADHRPERARSTGASTPTTPSGTNGVDPQNGGIVGSISYDTTRNELDPQYAAAEDWQPGVSGITVELYAPVACDTNAGHAVRRPWRLRARPPTGHMPTAQLLNTYVSRDLGTPDRLHRPRRRRQPAVEPGRPAGPARSAGGKGCLEGPLMGVQFGPYPTDQGTPDAQLRRRRRRQLRLRRRLLRRRPSTRRPVGARLRRRRVHCPRRRRLPRPHRPRRQGRRARRPDLQGHPRRGHQHRQRRPVRAGRPAAVVRRRPPPGRRRRHRHGRLRASDDPRSVRQRRWTVDGPRLRARRSTRPSWTSAASPYEGQARPLCDTKLVQLQNGKSVVPMFNVYTDVPLPGRFFGLNVDDLMFSTDPKSLLFGEKAGLPFNPVGIYDFSNRLITTVETDYNGIFDVLLPSTNRINCPTPSGVCANLYRFVGNDPGIPGRLNLNYNPQYRTIAAEFEALPGPHHPGRHRPDPGRRDRPDPRHPAEHPAVLPDQRPRGQRGQPRSRSCTPSPGRTRTGRSSSFRSRDEASAPRRATAS